MVHSKTPLLEAPSWVKTLVTTLSAWAEVHWIATKPVVLQVDNLTILCHSLHENPLATPKSTSLPEKCIHLWEDVWHTRQPQVLARLRHLLGLSASVPARLTQVRRMDKPTADSFLNNNHVQGSVSAKIKYGLYLPARYFRVLPAQMVPAADELLVAVATFTAPRKFFRDGREVRSAELVRLATLADLSVVGSFEKLLKAYILDYQPDDLMTYADADWSDGQFYAARGFSYSGQTAPQQFWVNPETFQRQVAAGWPGPEGSVLVTNSGSIKFVKFLTYNLPNG